MKSKINGFIHILNTFFFFYFILLIKGEKPNKIEEVINLIENKNVNKFINKNEIDKYYISYHNQSETIKKINIELIIYSGEVSLDLKELNSKKCKYKTANKIFFSLKYDDNNHSAYFNYTALVKAKVNSYYSIRYQPVDESLNFIDIPNYANYLFTMDPVDYKGKVNPLKISFNISRPVPLYLFTNFYSINCEFKIQGLDKNINLKTKDNYYYQNIANDFTFSTYMYMINIDMEEQDFYEKKICMLYVSTVNIDEVDKLDNSNQQILIAENIPQKIIFND